MARAHYIVRVGNKGFATTTDDRASNHWHYLSPQYLWGLPRGMAHVNVRKKFEADIEDPRVTTYIWFLCNGYGVPKGHFVQVGIGRRHLGQGPVGNGNPPIPADVMARLQQGFDHWFEWRPVTLDAAFQDQTLQLPVPHPPFMQTLRRVTEDHQSFEHFQTLIDSEEHQAAVATPASPAAAPAPAAMASASPAAAPPPSAIEIDLENLHHEQTQPHSQGHVYLIHMEGTMFYKIGMSLDPQIRLRTLQTGNPYPLQILDTQAVPDMRSAEIRLHQQFEAQRVPNPNVREWFDFRNGTGGVENAFSALG